jgi:hypothetical protein
MESLIGPCTNGAGATSGAAIAAAPVRLVIITAQSSAKRERKKIGGKVMSSKVSDHKGRFT